MTAERAASRLTAERLIDVSRETWERLETLVAVLDRWQAKINLVAPNTLAEIWTRHVADSAQVVDLAPAGARVWVDLGSGGGFPGLVAAAMRPDCEIHLVESTAKKAAFLREAARAMGATVVVHAVRIEAALGKQALSADVVSARALAPLPDLIGLAAPLLKTGAIGLFPKGKEATVELTQALECWRFEASLHPSRTDADARIVHVTSFGGKRDAGAGPEP